MSFPHYSARVTTPRPEIHAQARGNPPDRIPLHPPETALFPLRETSLPPALPSPGRAGSRRCRCCCLEAEGVRRAVSGAAPPEPAALRTPSAPRGGEGATRWAPWRGGKGSPKEKARSGAGNGCPAPAPAPFPQKGCVPPLGRADSPLRPLRERSPRVPWPGSRCGRRSHVPARGLVAVRIAEPSLLSHRPCPPGRAGRERSFSNGASPPAPLPAAAARCGSAPLQWSSMAE